AVLADLVNGDDVIVADGGRRTSLAEEPFPGRWCGEPRRLHGFQGNRSTKLDVLREKNNSHAAMPEHLEDPVASQPAQLLRRLARGEKGDVLVIVSLRAGGFFNVVQRAH